jgi:transcriptional regulator with XRE-family HTH domain
MEKNPNLRKILSRNIKDARKALHITQAKLALYADISLPYLTDIERCRTWVSDTTLSNIAKALNMKVYQLLIPQEDSCFREHEKEDKAVYEIVDLMDEQKKALKKASDDFMENLTQQVLHIIS